MSGEEKGSLEYRVAKRILFAIFLLLLAMVIFGIGGSYIFEIPFRFLFGWAIHAWKALPHLFGKWQEAVLPLGCLLMAAVIAHRFVRRWVDEKFPERTWRIRYTASALSLLLLGSAAAIAASGVVHQVFWLGTGKVIESNRRAELTMAVNNGRQLMLALYEYQANHGRYPESFEELVPELIHPESLRQLTWSGGRDGRAPEPWILLKPGFSGETIVPMILSPIIWSRGLPMVVVGYSDASMRSIRVENLANLLGESRLKESEGGR